MMGMHDYEVHARIAHEMAASMSLLTPHFAYQLILIIINTIFPITYEMAGAIATTLCQAATSAILFYFIIEACRVSTRFAMFLCLSLVFVMPIPVLFSIDSHLYNGYIGINVYHNPTIIILKPLALLVYIFMYRFFVRDSSCFKFKNIFFCAGITVLCVIAKPSYIICFLPALFMLILFNWRHDKLKFSRFYLCGFLVPSILILAFQYWLTFSQAPHASVTYKSKIILAPFVVMHSFSSYLLLKFVLSALFPISVIICYFQKARRNTELLFSWLVFFIGSIYTYLLAESPRMFHGNFLWSGQITLFILFISSVVFFVNNSLHGREFRQIISDKLAVFCCSMYLLHVVSGIIFYLAEYYSPWRFQ
jgi:hypothetical protein